ncbi:MAG: hypothetical protein ABI183_26460 [Polyangiaceae bacterium]
MKKLRVAIGALTAISAGAALMIACSGGDDSNGAGNGDASGDSNASSDGSSGSDAVGPPTDSGKNDGAPACVFDGGASDFLNDAIEITVGTEAACAIRVDHSLVCWGTNQFGYLGVDASTPTGYRPVAPQFPASAGALKFASVSAGNDHVCALDTNGHVWCWGANNNAALGNGSVAASPTAFLPGEVVDRAGAPIANITALAAGRHHSCAARSDGVLLCWGTNAAGELGGSDAGATSPFAIEMPLAPALGATGVTLTGSPFSLAICGASTTAAPFCIGSNSEQQLAAAVFNSNVNVAVNASLSDAGATPPATTFAMGDVTTCATDHAGAFYCWGHNSGNIFNGALPFSGSTGIPLKIPSLPLATQGALSQAFGCLVGSSGGITCWGSNQHGNLGSGDIDGSSAPMPPSAVVGFDGTGTLPPASNVEVGNNACAILTGSCGAGSVVCWGRGGDLGNDSGAQDSPIPLQVLAPNPDGGF